MQQWHSSFDSSCFNGKLSTLTTLKFCCLVSQLGLVMAVGAAVATAARAGASGPGTMGLLTTSEALVSFTVAIKKIVSHN